MAIGLTHRQAVLVLYGFCVLLGAAALILTYTSSLQSALLLVVIALLGFFFLRSLGYMRFERVSGAADDRRRNRAMRAGIRPLGQRLRKVRVTADIWPIVVEASTVFGAVGVGFRIVTGSPDAAQWAFAQGLEDPPAVGRLFRAQFSVPGGSKPLERVLELGWNDDRKEIDRDTEIAIDIFCEYLADTIDEIGGMASATAESTSTSAPRPI